MAGKDSQLVELLTYSDTLRWGVPILLWASGTFLRCSASGRSQIFSTPQILSLSLPPPSPRRRGGGGGSWSSLSVGAAGGRWGRSASATRANTSLQPAKTPTWTSYGSCLAIFFIIISYFLFMSRCGVLCPDPVRGSDGASSASDSLQGSDEQRRMESQVQSARIRGGRQEQVPGRRRCRRLAYFLFWI